MIWTPIFSDYNETICTKQSCRKCHRTDPWSNQTLLDTSRTTPIQFQNSLSETTYVNTRNIKITITRLVSIRVSWRCDDTVDNKRVIFLCTETPLLERVQQPKKSPKTPRKLYKYYHCGAFLKLQSTVLRVYFSDAGGPVVGDRVTVTSRVLKCVTKSAFKDKRQHVICLHSKIRESPCMNFSQMTNSRVFCESRTLSLKTSNFWVWFANASRLFT